MKASGILGRIRGDAPLSQIALVLMLMATSLSVTAQECSHGGKYVLPSDRMILLCSERELPESCADTIACSTSTTSMQRAGLTRPTTGSASERAVLLMQTTVPSGNTYSPMPWLALSLLLALAAGSAGYWFLRRRRLAALAEQQHASAPDVAPVVGILELADTDRTRFHLTADTTSIGRTSASDIVLDDPSISRKHAEIVRTEHGNYKIYDKESMNGMFVNDERRRRATLSDGDKLELGDAVLHFRVGEPAAISSETMVIQPDFDSAVEPGASRDDTTRLAHDTDH